jgi:hypothetical protein
MSRCGLFNQYFFLDLTVAHAAAFSAGSGVKLGERFRQWCYESQHVLVVPALAVQLKPLQVIPDGVHLWQVRCFAVQVLNALSHVSEPGALVWVPAAGNARATGDEYADSNAEYYGFHTVIYDRHTSFCCYHTDVSY